jgi:molecular chaperone Hsp33
MSAAPRGDALSRFVLEGAAVRGVRVHLAQTTRAILATHAYPRAIARVLAELTGATALLAESLKLDGTLTLQLVGDGPVRLIVVECRPKLALRAMAQWDEGRVEALGEDVTLEALAGGAQQARFAITLDPREGPMYQGIVALEAASVATMIEHYLEASEQVASKLALALDDGELCGVLLQRMPASGPADDGVWQRASVALDAAPPALIARAATSDDGLTELFPGQDLRVFSPTAPRFECTCSRSRVEGALRIAGRGEIEEALREAGEVEVVCEFCARRYTFSPDEARAVFGPESAEPPPTRH